MKTKISILLFCSAALCLQSCTLARVSGRGAVPLLFNQPDKKMELIKHISINVNRNFDYTNAYDISEIIAKEIGDSKPDAVINVAIVIRTGVDNFFLNLITLGIAQSRKIYIEADLMKEKR